MKWKVIFIIIGELWKVSKTIKKRKKRLDDLDIREIAENIQTAALSKNTEESLGVF